MMAEDQATALSLSTLASIRIYIKWKLQLNLAEVHLINAECRKRKREREKRM